MVSSTQNVNIEREPAAAGEETESGLDENIAGALSYLVGPFSGLIFYLIEKDNLFVRFHAAQSMAFAGVLFVAYITLTFFSTVVSLVTANGGSGMFLVGSLVGLVFGLVWLALSLGGFVAWVYLMVKAYQGKTPRIPIAAKIADRLV